MEVRVTYMTEFGSRKSNMPLSEVVRFTKRFNVMSIEEIELEIPVISSWNDMQIVDTEGDIKEGGEDDGNYGLCIRKNYLMSEYPNGVYIKKENYEN